jgi:hypothetical protein
MRNRFNAGLLVASAGVGLLAAGAPGAHAINNGRQNSTRRVSSIGPYHRTNRDGTTFQLPDSTSAGTGSTDQSQYGGSSGNSTSQSQYGGPWSKGSWGKGGSSGNSTSQSQYGGPWSKGNWGKGGSSGNSTSQSQYGGPWSKGSWGKGGSSGNTTYQSQNAGSDTSQSQNGGYSGYRSRNGSGRVIQFPPNRRNR